MENLFTEKILFLFFEIFAYKTQSRLLNEFICEFIIFHSFCFAWLWSDSEFEYSMVLCWFYASQASKTCRRKRKSELNLKHIIKMLISDFVHPATLRTNLTACNFKVAFCQPFVKWNSRRFKSLIVRKVLSEKIKSEDIKKLLLLREKKNSSVAWHKNELNNKIHFRVKVL